MNPRAFFDLFPEPLVRQCKVSGDASIIEIVGPVVHHEGGWFDSYDSISDRVDQAIASGSSTIVLKLDSPGGEASGCMDAAREIRAKCQKAGRRLVAFVDGQACSAAYALACAAEYIAIPPAGIAGSIGVLHMRVDTTQQDAMMGTSFTLISSSGTKGDNNPHVPVTEAELARTQETVNKMAAEFFQLVADSRGLTPESVSALDARLFVGAEAVGVGLADVVASFNELLASISAGTATKESLMGKAYEDVVAALRKMAEGDTDEAKKAKRMLRAELEDEKEEQTAEASEGESDDDKKKEEDEKAQAAAAASPAPAPAAVSAPAPVASTQGGIDAARFEALEADARSTFLATRPDLPKDFVALVQSKPLAEVKALVNAIPKPTKPNHAASVAPAATRAAGQDGRGAESRLPEAEKQALDQRMGLCATASIGVEKTPHRLTLGAPVVVAGKVG